MLWFLCTPWIPTMLVRKEARRKYNIDGTLLEDAALSFCCTCCVQVPSFYQTLGHKIYHSESIRILRPPICFIHKNIKPFHSARRLWRSRRGRRVLRTNKKLLESNDKIGQSATIQNSRSMSCLLLSFFCYGYHNLV